MTNDPRITRTQKELHELYQDQLKMLVKRCNSYYEGDCYEARDIASILRKLLYDYGNTSKSVLEQLGEKFKYKYLDSRMHNNLAMASTKGAWPRTPTPYTQYNERNFCGFEEWWEKQPFQVVYRDIVFTRRELVLIVANQEGGDHVAEKINKKIAALKRIKSPWNSLIVGNDDGTTSMQVWYGSGDPESSEDPGIYGFELASVCAIGEELLFSLTPEPENRKRIHFVPWQKPYYLNLEDSDKCKCVLRDDLDRINNLLEGELSQIQKIYASSAQQSLIKALEIECLTSEDFNVRNGVAYLMKQAELPWLVSND